jgi:uncharacterized protein (UPF0305 family)
MYNYIYRVELKNLSDTLNLETMNLNKAVEQTRIMHSFLLDRKRKLDALKEYLQQISIKNDISNKMKKLKFDSNKKSATHNEKIEMTLEIMERLGKELDYDAEVCIYVCMCINNNVYMCIYVSWRDWGRS